jgi:branched-chain amino acid transport system permease protein
MKLTAFVISSSLTAFSGALFAYFQGVVAADAFTLYLTIQYVAMIIIGGIGTLNGAVYGAIFVTLMPYGLEKLMSLLPNAGKYAGAIFAVNSAAFGLVMVLFLMFEPGGLNALFKRFGKKP